MASKDTYMLDTDSSVTDANKVGYAQATDTRFTTTEVVKRIYLNTRSIKYDLGVYTQIAETPGKDINQDHLSLMAYGDFIGFANPTINIEGTIDLSSYSTTDAKAAISTDDQMIVSLQLLQQMFKSGHVFTLTDVYDDTPTPDIYRIHSLTGTFPNESVSGIKVRILGVTASTNTQVMEGARVDYSLKLREVRG